MQYGLNFILDAAIHGDLLGVREHAALMAVDLEQVAQDQGRWDLGFQLMLLEDPPPDVDFQKCWIGSDGRRESLCGSLSSALGYHSACLLKGDRLHPGQENRLAQSSKPSTFHTSRSQEEGCERKGKMWRRQRNAAIRRAGDNVMSPSLLHDADFVGRLTPAVHVGSF